jgi:uncharacterized protein YjbI with pentapeptide repeats
MPSSETMTEATRAPVKPRILSSATGSVLPLEDEVQWALDRRGPALFVLAGGPGSGKSTALGHLAAIFTSTSRLRLVDDGDPLLKVEFRGDDVIVYVGPPLPIGLTDRTLVLAQWQRDELIEYLLAQHPQITGAVIARISNADIQEFQGNPEIWRVILDELAVDAKLLDPSAALVHYLRARIPSDELWERLGSECLEEDRNSLVRFEGSLRLLVHAPVRRVMAAEHLAARLKDSGGECQLPALMPRALVDAVARRIGDNETAHSQLQVAMHSKPQQPMAASLLYALDSSWKPEQPRRINLKGAYLDGVSWRGVWLQKANLRDANLGEVDLRDAMLDEADASHADFSRARLSGASLTEFYACGAHLSGADLSSARADKAVFDSAKLSNAKLDDASLHRGQFLSADLSGASLRRANLNRANLQLANLAGADFTGTDLTEADLRGQDLRNSCLDGSTRLIKAVLVEADLEGMQLDGVDLAGAQLNGALLTGTSMNAGDLTGCCLRSAGLADVDWENACLRGADLRWASFHLGSSRSGLVGSPIASEGSRTGFYTDDFGEQDFKPPEEIRKANLRNADLRGAIIDGVDFYLVDLRGAKYEPRQAEHFRRCGAILEDRCPQ